MPARTLASKVLSVLFIFVFLFSNTSVALAQQPDPATPTPAAPAPSATPEAATETPAAPTEAPAAAPAPTETQAPAPTETSAPTVFSISGKLTGTDGQPLAGVTVADDQGTTTLTGTDGTYTLPGLPPGAYLVAPKLEGQVFLPYYRVVKLAAKDASGVDFYVPVTNPDAVKAPTNQPAGAPTYPPHPPASAGEISSQAVYTPGAAGLAYRYDSQKGQADAAAYPLDPDGAITHLNTPVGVALDHSGNLLVAEEKGSQVVRFNAGGSSTLSIGTAGVRYTGNDVFSHLLGIAEQPVTHTIWAADNSRLAEYDAAGNWILNFPSDQPDQIGSENGRFNGARGIAFNGDGSEMYVSDTYNNRVQVFDFSMVNGVSTPTWVKNMDGTALGGDGIPFSNPWHLTFYDDFVYVADFWNNRIQKCDPAPTVPDCITLPLAGAAIDVGFGIPLSLPTSIAIGSIGGTPYAFITDGYNQRVVRCEVTGANCVHFAGAAGEPGSDADHFFWPEDVSVGPANKVYVADKFNHIVQIFDGSLTPSPKSDQRGTLRQPYAADSDGSHLNAPFGVAIAPNGNMYVAEQMGLSLVKYTSPGGAFEWRRGQAGSSGIGQWMWWGSEPEYTGVDVDHFSSVGIDGALGVDSHGRIYVPDIADYRVVIYLPDGTVFATLGDGYGTDNYHFNCPTAVAIQPGTDNIYVADSCNARVQVYDSQRHYKGTLGVTQVEGNDNQHFAWPHGLAVDASGNVFVADQNNMRVQKCQLLASSFTCQPFAGVPGMGGPDFRYTNWPVGISIGPDGLIYVVEQWQNRVEVFDPSGAYRTTLGGNWGNASGLLRSPGGVAVDSSNNVYVADTTNNRLVKYSRGVPAGPDPSVMPGWTQLNVNGWGEQMNGRSTPIRKVTINSQDYLYVGTENSTDQPGSPSVRRMDSAGNWQVVSAPGFGDLNNSSIVDMFVYGVAPNEYLYANTFNWNGAQIWRCPLSGGCDQNSDWHMTTVTGQSAHDSVFTPFQTFGSDLYMSSASYYLDGGVGKTDGAKVWKLVGDTWVYAGLTLDDTQAGAVLTSIQSLAEFSGHLLAGSSDWVNNNPGQLWRFDGTTWDPLTLDGFGNPNNSAILSLVVFKNNLYVGTANSKTGGRIYSYDTSFNLTPIITDGFGDIHNSQIQSLAADDTYIYAVTTNSVTGLQIWRSSDGNHWDKFLSSDGFGSSLNAGPDLSSSLLLANNRVYLGTWNNINGGGVWASDPFTPYSISGGISTTPPATLPDSIVITLQPGGATTVPAPDGKFLFSHLGAGSYTVTPARAGCTFTPTAWQATISGDVNNANFSVACTPINLLSPADGAQLNSLDPVTLSWSPVAGATSATKYTLTVSTSPSFANTIKSVTQATTGYVFSGLANGATYYWHVKVAAPAGPWSVRWSFTGPVPPAAPTLSLPPNSSTLVIGNLRPVFTWKAASVPTNGKPVEHYHLQVSQKNTFDSPDLDEYTRDTSLSYTMPFDLSYNRVYYWRMRSFNTSGGYSKWSSVYSFKVLPGEVGLDDINNGSTLLRPTFTWHDDWNTGKYTIQICKRSGSTCSLFKSATVTALSYPLTASLLPHTLYNWRVQAVGITGAGPWTDYMSWTSPAPPAVPTLAWPAANAILPDATHPGYQPTLVWSNVTGASYYEMQISTDAGFSSDGSTTNYSPDGGAPSQMVDGLLRNQNYWWQARACNNNSECSVWTAARKLTTRPDVPAPDAVYSVDSTGVYNFSWTDDNPNPAAKYNVQICNTYNCSSIFKSATVTNSREYQLLLPSDKDMFWRVQGVGITTGNWMDPPELVQTIVTPAVPVLANPPANALVSLPLAIPPNITFTWQPVAGADGYEFQIAYNTPTFDDTDVPQDVPGTSAKALAYGTDYWRVRANQGGNWGQWSAARKVLVKPAVGGQVQSWLTDGSVTQLPGSTVTMPGYNSFQYNSAGTYYYYFPPNLPVGARTITASMDGYLPATRTLNLANGGNYIPTNFWLSPVNPDPNAYRVVLSWDDPSGNRDLDLHAWLPPATPGHIYYGNTGALAASPYALLSMHDQSPTAEVLDFGQMLPGKYVIGVNQYFPDSGPWSGANVKVEVFLDTTLQKSCVSPSGTGLWWYAMDITVPPVGSNLVFTCKNKIQTAIPVTTPDKTITGTIKQPNGHAVHNVDIDYGAVDPANVDSPFVLTGLGNGPYTLNPSKQTGGNNWTFSQLPLNPVSPGTDVKITAYPPASIMVGGDPNAVAAQGDYLYVGGGGKLYIVNVKDKSSPTVTSALWVGEDDIVDIAVQGNYAYLAESTGLDILDISDPANPTIVGSYVGSVDTVTVSGYYAYLTSGMDLIIMDLHDPAKPKVAIDYYWATVAADRVLVNGNYAYVGGEDGLWVFNVTDPSKATYLSHWASDSGNPIVGLAWNNGRLIVTDTNAVYGVNVDNPANVFQDPQVDLPDGVVANQSTAVGNTLYVSAGADGLLLYDISQPWNGIQPLGSLLPTDTAYTAAAQDTYAYVIDGTMVQFVDATRRGAPTPAGSFTPAP